MYNHFWGLRERPFKLVPDPAFLFLSRGHEEALAHLTYAVCQGDGFVAITGEVGTGKTTLCREFLDRLDQQIPAAYIFNPRLDAVQLLKAINAEFGADPTPDSAKDLIDALNRHLLSFNKVGHPAILIIDEAQNLAIDVLEQLRLVSNLETTKDKLITIVLVGQPELGDMLEGHELRQLAQRITLNYHLLPLGFRETCQYVRHRIRLASEKPALNFSPAALYRIHRFSGGIPRLINMACDRCLLVAYGLSRKRINDAVARTAIREIKTAQRLRRKGRARKDRYPRPILVGLGILAVALAVMIVMPEHFLDFRDKIHETFKAPVALPPQPAAFDTGSGSRPKPPENIQTGPASEIEAPAPTVDLKAVLPAMGEDSLHLSIETVLALWGFEGSEAPPGDARDFQQLVASACAQNGLSLLFADKGLDLLKILDLPAILPLRPSPGVQPVYMVLVGLGKNQVRLRGPVRGDLSVRREELAEVWRQTAYVPWRNFYQYPGLLPQKAAPGQMITLKLHLREIGFPDLPVTPDSDSALREAIQRFQQMHNIDADGMAGPITQILMYNQSPGLRIPLLSGPEHISS